MKQWIYFATAEKASLASTIETITNSQFLWRSSTNKNGAQIANVGGIQPGDHIIVAWRHSSTVKKAYLRCSVSGPFLPVIARLAIDRLTGPGAKMLITAGYPTNSEGEVEGIRLDEIRECYFDVHGSYGGNNAIHRLAVEDISQLSSAASIPPNSLDKAGDQIKLATVIGTIKTPSEIPITPSTFESCDLDHVEIRGRESIRAFDAYIMVDWSSSSSPAMGNDSIWIASGAWSGNACVLRSPQNVPTRVEAVGILRQKLLNWQNEGKRVLVGFDFAFGYPAGFAKALGVVSDSGSAWKALHEHFSAAVKDSAQNVHNRDSFADDCNRRVGAPGPFWGCAARSATHTLTQQRIGIFHFPHRGLEEWRVTDLAARKRVTTQSVWKLNCGVSVGGQTILGIKHLDELARSVHGYRWPFDGWGTPERPAIWFAEIFPSLVRYPEWGKEYSVRRDRTQVQSCVRYAAERDANGILKQDLARPGMLDHATVRKLEEEEGWILWV